MTSTEAAPSTHTGTHIFDKLTYWAILLLIVVMPFCVIPSMAAPFQHTKLFVAGVLTFVALLFFTLARLKAQDITAPKVLLLGAAWLIPLAYFLSTLFQGSRTLQFFGERTAIDSFMFMLVGVIALSLTALVLHTKERMLGAFLAFLASAGVLAFLELIVFFAHENIAALGLYVPGVSLMGSLNDLATFFGLITVLLLISLTRLPLTPMIRGALWVGLVASAFFLIVVNLPVLWWILGGFALAVLVYSFYSGKQGGHGEISQQISFAALGIVLVSALFLLGSDVLTGKPAAWVNVGELDVRPSWSTTIGIGRTVYENSAVLGSGPGSFSSLWSSYRPLDVDQTEFWNADFIFGIGFLPTSFITTGLLGFAAWVLFLALLLVSGVKRFVLTRGAEGDTVSSYLRTASFTGALYLWIVMFIQVPSPVIIMYAFIMVGLYIATLRTGPDAAKVLHLSFTTRPKLGFMVTLLLTVSALGSFLGIYGLSTRYVADVYFQRAVLLINTTGDSEQAESLMTQAISLHPVDVYERLMANIQLTKLQKLVAQNKPPEEIREQFQAILSTAVAHAQEATVLDAGDYQNWLTLSTVYQSIVPLGIEGAADSAMVSLDKALELRPDAPAIVLSKALLKRSQGNAAEARTLVEKAITQRNSYTDAIFLLAQLQIEENQLEDAIRSVQAAILVEPNNPVGYFQLGLLYYSMNKFPEAASALEQAVARNTQYANARYFLGLSQWRLGNRDAAIAQFVEVQKTNVDNAEVKQIIENMRAGREPFETLTPAQQIEQLDGPPVEEVTDQTDEQEQ